MIDHKPLSDEELDGFESGLRWQLAHYPADHPCYLDEATFNRRMRLITQAREANRLREGGAFRAGAEAFKRAALENEEARLKRELDNDTHAGTAESWRQNYTCRHVELPTEDPAARAKRELGGWLADDMYNRCTDLFRTGEGRRDWVCRLRGRLGAWTGFGPTEHEAITAAIKAARESGR